jgi:hypothetical protein
VRWGGYPKLIAAEFKPCYQLAMKLQYLGDARDAFKWDLLHWLCTASTFTNLIFVPLLTPDLEGSGEGLIPHHRFKCRDIIRPFLDSLKEEPRSLDRISALGSLDPSRQFRVSVIAPQRVIGTGFKRRDYWTDFDPSTLENSVVFFDPDNGYETKTRYQTKKPIGPKWIGHDELRNLFTHLPATSIAVVYQHKPHRKWSDLFRDLTENLVYVHTAVVAHESDLAFVAMAGNADTGKAITTAMHEYARRNPPVAFTSLLFGSHNPA